MNSNLNILDEPVGLRLKNGYIFCPNCGQYEHHPLIYCGCGSKFIREKKLTWREFLKITAHGGSGPILTFHKLLTGSAFDDPNTEDERRILNEAQQIVKQAEEEYKQNEKNRIILIFDNKTKRLRTLPEGLNFYSERDARTIADTIEGAIIYTAKPDYSAIYRESNMYEDRLSKEYYKEAVE